MSDHPLPRPDTTTVGGVTVEMLAGGTPRGSDASTRSPRGAGATA